MDSTDCPSGTKRLKRPAGQRDHTDWLCRDGKDVFILGRPAWICNRVLPNKCAIVPLVQCVSITFFLAYACP